jgi:hypothetical protein
MTDFFADLERELRRAHRRDTESHARSRRVFDLRRRLPVLPATGLPALVALAVVAALVAVVVTVARESDDERPAAPQPTPGKKAVTEFGDDVERGVRFVLDGRVLTVSLLPPVRNQTFETVSGARISATCGAPPGDPRRETTLTRRWPDGQTSTSYRFPRDVSSWCRLYDQSGSIVASVSFPGARSGARALIAETANKWARHFASSPQTCTGYMSRTACEQVTCRRVGGRPIPDCRPSDREWGAYFRGATVQAIAISGDRAAATLSNDEIVQLRRIATGEWLIDRMGPLGAVGPDAAAQRRQRGGP